MEAHRHHDHDLDDHEHDHGHGHEHSHHHGPGHGHAPADFGRAFAMGVVLNTGFVVIEGAYGILSGSMALVADAGHNLSDVLGLLIAWGATILSKRSPNHRFTYGLKSSSILAALINAALLLVAVGAIALETVQRFLEPAPVDSLMMIIVAAIGIVINGSTALLFMGGRHGDLNIRGAYLHMAADALVSLGVVAAGVLIMLTGALWIDPLTSLVIILVIAAGSWGLLRDAVKMSLLAVPANIDHGQVAVYLRGQPGVADVHDLHIWSISTTETALTAHLFMPGGHPGNAFIRGLTRDLEAHFRIDHVTIQIEVDQDEACGQDC
ncbi:cation diffusion facilitator family transporter [Sphingobium nicotianae]|uniref:Cation diffusion facilitator family transporter n=1 Tax=Sphingobium nicotianae TaxID=2782607 RepID=A0A9X1DD04_9SPHN|nr:cation diffusion facilitator family transporter [Sphingobium nicotianae]MBT2187625.1 cation diffusion facilitator family transporter [Sphingobium nicotianae]